MAYTLGNKCAKNLCKRIVLRLLQLIIENLVTFFLEHSVVSCSIVTVVISCIVYKINLDVCRKLGSFIPLYM